MTALFIELCRSAGVPQPVVVPVAVVAAAGVALALAIIAYGIVRGPLLAALVRLIRRTLTRWDDVLLDHRLLHRLTHLAPILVLYHLLPRALAPYPELAGTAALAVQIYLTVVLLLFVGSVLNAVLTLYHHAGSGEEISLKSFVQFIKVVVYSVGAIFIISLILGKSPFFLLSGLGAMTAVLLLVFRDPIMGFVAGVQLTANQMLARDDWIEMPKYGADGSVVDVSLTTVKVQNWDKTVTTVPTYALISESFRNWRGMQESGGRRIKRAVYIDVNSIRFCDAEMLARFGRIQYIREYLERKQAEVAEHNQVNQVDTTIPVNGRRLTNIGTFRAYLTAYLQHNPMINQDMTQMVRQLAPTEHGLPVEIYAFCSDVAWVTYEGVQADLFDHILAVIPEFDLRHFQVPSGRDFAGWRGPGSAESGK